MREKDAEPMAGTEADAGPLLAVWGTDRRLEVYRDKLLMAPAGASGEAAYVSPCAIPIKDIVSIEFTSSKETVTGCMTVNYTAAPPDETVTAVNLSESVLFDAGANQEMAKAMELIKQCRMGT